ncbi:hypothetical protein N9O61_02010 [Octadecabacter sp.]|nr:hypothetical protein [Octadecabacter sp.]
MRWLGRIAIFALLTILTQVGGLAYLVTFIARRFRLAIFVAAYAFVWVVSTTAAPAFGREPLPCFGKNLRLQSPIYCVLLRHFVVPELADVAQDAADQVAAKYPGTVTLALDASFPFITGFPMLPHLSHDDGEKLDFAFYYKDETGYVGPRTSSPIGFFAFETLDVETCPPAWITLRWDLRPLQPFMHDWAVEDGRNTALMQTLLDDPRVGKILLEPPLAQRWNLSHPNLRFQGCRAARHDDHIHMQL